MLERIGTRMLLSTISIVIVALVEMKQLKTTQEHGLIDMPNSMVPMRVWWLVPQYILFGLSNMFTTVGLQDFFYDQVPNESRSVSVTLYLNIFGVRSFFSNFLISAIKKETSKDGQDSWLNDHLNMTQLDYFYWLLYRLIVLGLAAYIHFAKSYIYNRRSAPWIYALHFITIYHPNCLKFSIGRS